MNESEIIVAARIADLVLIVMAIQASILIARAPSRAIDVLSVMMPGAFLTLALRAALNGEPWLTVALWVALSGPAHVYDLRRRGLYARR